MASGCARRATSLDDILGKNFSLKGSSGTGSGCPGKLWNHHSWKHSKNTWMWHFGMQYSGGLSAELMLDSMA